MGLPEPTGEASGASTGDPPLGTTLTSAMADTTEGPEATTAGSGQEDEGTTSGSPTDGGTSAGGETGATNMGPPADSILIEDGFEGASAEGPPDGTKWAAYPQGQESLGPIVDGQEAYRGSHAARVQSTSSGLGAFLVPASGPLGGEAVQDNAFYVRVFMRWEKETSMISGHSGFLVGAASRDNSGTEVRLGISSKGPGSVPRLDLNLQNPSDGGGETTRYSNGFTDGGNPNDFPEVGFQFSAATWYCVEALFYGDPAASEFRVWIDGTEVEAMHVTDFSGNPSSPRTMWAPSYQYIKIGAQDYDANLGQIWYDEVVVATAPIGCDYAVP